MAKYSCIICKSPTNTPYCWKHKRNKEIKQKPLRQKSGVSLSKIADKEKMIKLFVEILNERKDENGWLYCFETGVKIPKRYYDTTLIYHHLLEKGIEKYKKYKFEKWNIYTILPEVHTLTHSDIDKTPRLKAEKERLIEQKSL